MKSLSFINLIMTFLFSLIKFTVGGWIGWLGIVLILLRVFGIIHWPWWIALLPLEYGAIYSLYMTIDGARFRAGLKDAGAFARFTSGLSNEEIRDVQIQQIINEGPEFIGETIDKLSTIKSRLKFNQELLDASLKHYYLLQLAVLGNKNVKADETTKKWSASGLKLPEKGTPEFG